VSESTRELAMLIERVLNKSLNQLMQEIREEIEWECRVFSIDLRMMTLKTEELFK
jgi:hypothetical protein